LSILFPCVRSRLSPFESGGDATSVLTEAYRLLVPRVAMRSGVTVMRTRGSVCQRAREPSTWSATLATRVTGALSSRWKGGQPTLIEGQEPLPMALGRRLVIAPTLRKGEAVRHARVELDRTGHTGLGEEALQCLDHGQRCERVMLGAGHRALALHLAQRALRALLRLADQPRGVQRGSGDAGRGSGRPRLRRMGHSYRSPGNPPGPA
jgi:hypothetical protein